MFPPIIHKFYFMGQTHAWVQDLVFSHNHYFKAIRAEQIIVILYA